MGKNITFNTVKEIHDFTATELSQFETITVKFDGEPDLFKRNRGLELYCEVYKNLKVVAFTCDFGNYDLIKLYGEDGK
ncbi:hypothetical protein Aeh1ORF162c [Aeromonas phage Aeh1]|uniref:Uncharacterized protein n=1 Tax=Aeromonas phage Aeh1 TaxID=2880362 RepID=Q76YR8_9CAUD|nr:hypothetical protein Aeh1p173 [Aeromonas phage Aeh1]AAQ17828.1 hypothetical protein Aeh1ORF162c [Aeromonas phage Aeh1]